MKLDRLFERHGFATNLIAFNLLWAALVLGAARGLDGVAIVLVMAWIALHLRYSAYRKFEMRLIATAALFGPMTDLLVLQLDLIEYRGVSLSQDLPPLWIHALWALFASTLLHSLGWLRRHLALAVAMGGIGGPLAYYAGVRLDAAQLTEPYTLGLGVISICWAMLMPAMIALTRPVQAQGESRT